MLRNANSFVYTPSYFKKHVELNRLTLRERNSRTDYRGFSTLFFAGPTITQRLFFSGKMSEMYLQTPFKTCQSTTTRLFGSNPATSNEPGGIDITDERDDTKTIPIDIIALHKTIDTVRDILGYPTYDITLQLIDEDFMKEVNNETRGKDESTDVLSFSFTECEEPGILKDVPSHSALIGDMYCLGDLLVCVDYVARKCEEDKRNGFTLDGKQYHDIIEGEVVCEDVSASGENDDDDDEDAEYEYQDIEVEVEDEWDTRGVAPALLTTYDPEIRIHMLIVHGMLHLVGYDHIDDDDEDYELMVVKEDEVMAELKRRIGDDFGLCRKRLSPGNSTVANDIIKNQ